MREQLDIEATPGPSLWSKFTGRASPLFPSSSNADEPFLPNHGSAWLPERSRKAELTFQSLLRPVFISAALVTFMMALYFNLPNRFKTLDTFDAPVDDGYCSPRTWSSGKWVEKPSREWKDDLVEMSGFEGCASSEEVGWHLGVTDNQDMKEYRKQAGNWLWQPACAAPPFDKEQMVRTLVETGGWLLVGGELGPWECSTG